MGLVVFEAVALLGVVLGALPFALGGVVDAWIVPAGLAALTVCAGIFTAVAWSVSMRVTATVQGLLAGCCLVMLLIGLGGGFT
ncbi:hypothetical protein [Streptomyces sp. Ag109_O5-10]|uniref:hypothetical protein n=1 Tax=Streptomyces sp. Ag109_O5-10 TaxID=1855349 RepID=UPI000B8656ED|nr:hypothetical protein [Streptomyces sp. Ag109_O5-10]